MTNAEFASHVRRLTRTDSVTFTDAEILAIMNLKAKELAKSIVDVDEDYFGTILYEDLKETATSREYPLTTTLQDKFKRVEAKLDGTNWTVLQEMDLSDYNKSTDENTILENFTNEYGGAFYDVYGGSLWLYTGEIGATVATASNQYLKIWGYIYPYTVTDLALTTELTVVPTAGDKAMPGLIHEVWADSVSISWKQSHDVPVALSEREQNYAYHLQNVLNKLKAIGKDRAIIAEVPREESYNDGYNL